MKRQDYDLLRDALRHNRPQGDRLYGPCPRQVEGYEKACRAVAHALSVSDPRFIASTFLREVGADQPSDKETCPSQ